MAREEGCWAQILNGAAKAKTKTNLRIILSSLELLVALPAAFP
jgi:hypothetical protein